MVRTSAPRDVALARAADGLLAVVLDGAGGLEAIRLDANGAVRARTRFAPEPGGDEIEALGDGVLARRRDQVLVWLDATGAERATLAATPGEHVRTIATGMATHSSDHVRAKDARDSRSARTAASAGASSRRGASSVSCSSPTARRCWFGLFDAATLDAFTEDNLCSDE